MPDRRCAEQGCETFPDAAWAFCAEHMAEQEARGAAWATDVAAPREAEVAMPDPIGPDCRDGKHPACHNLALDDFTDQIVHCACPCHWQTLTTAPDSWGFKPSKEEP